VFDRDETARQLIESLRLLEAAVARTPERWHRPAPAEGPPGAWGVAMNLAHLVVYEESHPVPVLEAIAASAPEPPGSGSDEALDRATAELAAQPLERILDRLRAARQRQAAAVRAISDGRFAAPSTHRWGRPPRSAAWVAAKTVQHTWEHGNTVMQFALFYPP